MTWNRTGQQGMRRDNDSPSTAGGCEVRARFCWEFRTARRGFDSRHLLSRLPAALSRIHS